MSYAAVEMSRSRKAESFFIAASLAASLAGCAGMDPNALEAVRLQHTPGLPGLPFGK